MDWEDEALAAWEACLRLSEEELRQREAGAQSGAASPSLLLGLAADHDQIALDRDMVAALHDERAAGRDLLALDRDLSGSARDRRARELEDDLDAAFADRSFSGEDRDYSAGDRADSHDDRGRGRHDREHAAADRARAATDREHAAEAAAAQAGELDALRAALEVRLVIGQAQGLLMAQENLRSEAAFALLVRRAKESQLPLSDAAKHVVTDAEAHQDQLPSECS